jgi:Sec23-binding domain of Sec16
MKDELKLGTSGISLVCRSNSSFLLHKFAAKFTAADAPDAHYTLLGADQSYGKHSYVGIPQVLLSEIFEYSQSKLAPEGFLHLLPYKLWHAWVLTDYGYLELAERYFPIKRG